MGRSFWIENAVSYNNDFESQPDQSLFFCVHVNDHRQLYAGYRISV